MGKVWLTMGHSTISAGTRNTNMCRRLRKIRSECQPYQCTANGEAVAINLPSHGTQSFTLGSIEQRAEPDICIVWSCPPDVAATRSKCWNQLVGNRYVHCTLSRLSLNGFDEVRLTLPHELINPQR